MQNADFWYIQVMDKTAFDTARNNNTLHIAFVGMSNAGKSYRSRTLNQEKGFVWFDIDTQIARALGLATVDDVAVWLGNQDAADFEQKQKQYLALEERYVLQACAQVRQGESAVCDTTGSVVHLSSDVQQKLKDAFLVVHLDVGQDGIAKMMEKFFAHPKPVMWDGFFTKQEEESLQDALRRSYPILLQERLRRYNALAHVTVPALALRDQPADTVLDVIHKHL